MKWRIMGFWAVVALVTCSGPKVQLDESKGTEPLEEQITLRINDLFNNRETALKWLVIKNN